MECFAAATNEWSSSVLGENSRAALQPSSPQTPSRGGALLVAADPAWHDRPGASRIRDGRTRRELVRRHPLHDVTGRPDVELIPCRFRCTWAALRAAGLVRRSPESRRDEPRVPGSAPGGQSVRITGDFFQTGVTVEFGNTPARRVGVVSACTGTIGPCPRRTSRVSSTSRSRTLTGRRPPSRARMLALPAATAAVSALWSGQPRAVPHRDRDAQRDREQPQKLRRSRRELAPLLEDSRAGVEREPAVVHRCTGKGTRREPPETS